VNIERLALLSVEVLKAIHRNELKGSAIGIQIGFEDLEWDVSFRDEDDQELAHDVGPDLMVVLQLILSSLYKELDSSLKNDRELLEKVDKFLSERPE
jgi:hypothetical protein